MTLLQVTDLKVALNLPWTLVGVLMSKVSVALIRTLAGAAFFSSKSCGLSGCSNCLNVNQLQLLPRTLRKSDLSQILG